MRRAASLEPARGDSNERKGREECAQGRCLSSCNSGAGMRVEERVRGGAHIGHVCVAHAAELIHLRVRGVVLGLDGPAARARSVRGGPEQVRGDLKGRECHVRKGRTVVRTSEGEGGRERRDVAVPGRAQRTGGR